MGGGVVERSNVVLRYQNTSPASTATTHQTEDQLRLLLRLHPGSRYCFAHYTCIRDLEVLFMLVVMVSPPWHQEEHFHARDVSLLDNNAHVTANRPRSTVAVVLAVSVGRYLLNYGVH